MAKRTCSVEGCEKPTVTRGWCQMHYVRWRRHGDPEALGWNPVEGSCSVDGCDDPAKSRGWCNRHYHRWAKHGDPMGGGKVRRRRLPWPESLLQRMEPQPNGCIYFTGYLDDHGYGVVATDDGQRKAHRAAFEHFVGPIPEGMTLDHECHNGSGCIGGDTDCLHRRCVNVEHLKPKPTGENQAASHNSNAAKTHCPQGHAYDEKNTYLWGGGRRCRLCAAAAQARRRAKRRAQAG